jgi:hypothetical protein
MTTGTKISHPRVFVSSTINDLADLRSALKFWLEEMGFEVQMSEFNDFERKPELNAFDACFDSIKESDYYILIVGKRRGSWYDEPNRVSVTRHEYRTAYESAVKTGKPKLVNFVRSEVMTALQERSAIAAGGLPTEAGSTLEDAEFTAEFLDEVTRQDQVKAAVVEGGPYPPGNWLTRFSSFRDLVDGLTSGLRIRGPLPKVAILENLRHELERNLRITMMRQRGRPFYHHLWIDRLRDEVKIHPDQLKDQVVLTKKQLQDMAIYVLTGIFQPEGLARAAVDDGILSSALLDYDRGQDRFVPSPLLEALYQLREELGVYEMRYKGVSEERFKWTGRYSRVRDSRSDREAVPVWELASVYALHDSQHNIVRLTMGILRHLYGHTKGVDVMLRPVTPIVGMEEEIRAERVSEEQLRQWLIEDDAFLQMGTTDLTEEQRRATREMWKTLEERLGKEELERILKEIVLGEPPADSPPVTGVA